jgi:hypothetical protein
MQTIMKQDSGWRQATSQFEAGLRERWDAMSLPGGEHTENALSAFLQGPRRTNRVLNCAIPLTRAKALTDFSLPEGLTIQQCIEASATGNVPECLRDWEYTPQIRAVPQLPQMMAIPPEHASLTKVPWFQSASQSAWLGMNARHVRYHYQLWQDLKPQVLQGVVTTLILGLPQIGFALTPHIQLEKSFLFLASLARGLCPVQLFPAKYLYPQTKLGELGDAPAPIFADILPATGGFAYPTVDCEPDPWRVLARFGNGDRFYGYPFRNVNDSSDDFSLQDHERGAMLLPNGSRVPSST